MKSTFLYTLVLFAFCTVGITVETNAQRNDNSKARIMGEIYLDQGRYVKALEMFDKHRMKEDIYLDESFLKLQAKAYYRLGRFDEALHCYAMVLNNPNERVDSLFMKGLLRRSTDPSQFAELGFTDDFKPEIDQLYAREGVYTVTPLHLLNGKSSEFGLVEYKDYLYFASNRNSKKVDKNSKIAYYDVFRLPIGSVDGYTQLDSLSYKQLSAEQIAQLTEKKEMAQIAPVSWLNSRYNDGPVMFWNDSMVYSTRNDAYKKRDRLVFNLNLYHSVLYKDETHIHLKPSEFSDYFSPNSVGHIAFSPSRTCACMVSKKNIERGNSDLYFSDYVNGHWCRPYNAGKQVNTKGDEVFPFFGDDGLLYFSSDGYSGYGGLDVYCIDLNDEEKKAKNLGNVVNSPADDFCFSINHDGKGYLTSNRKGGQGRDDLYRVNKNSGTIHIVLVCDPDYAIDPWLKLSDEFGGAFESFNIAEVKKISYPNMPYGAYALHHLLRVDSLYSSFTLQSREHTVYVDFPYQVDSLMVRFSNFAFDKHNLSEINQENFHKLVNFLKGNSDIEVHIKGHTDQFGSEAYNMKLGMDRCDAMEEFLHQQGIENTIQKESFGRTQLVSKVDHRLNRRVDVELHVPGQSELLTFVPRGERGRKVDLRLSYDDPTRFDTPIEPGFYVRFFSSKTYKPAYKVATEQRLPRNLTAMIYSQSSYAFDYYIKMPFTSQQEAEEFASDVLQLKRYEVHELQSEPKE